ncbi:MAG: hypothetical protein AB8G15_20885 [Saprospiraceae bacterium]
MITPMHIKSTRYYQADQLTEQVYAIIDSRIQYLEFRASKFYQTYTDKNERLTNPSAKSNLIFNQFEQLLSGINQLSKSLKLLSLLRTKLIKDNARTILYLLTNNKYLNHTEESLKRILIKKNNRQLVGR